MNRAAIMPLDRVSASPLLTAKEAATAFGRSVRTWRQWDASGLIPRPIRIGRSTYWRPEEISAWIAAGCPRRKQWEGRPRNHA